MGSTFANAEFDMVTLFGNCLQVWAHVRLVVRVFTEHSVSYVLCYYAAGGTAKTPSELSSLTGSPPSYPVGSLNPVSSQVSSSCASHRQFHSRVRVYRSQKQGSPTSNRRFIQSWGGSRAQVCAASRRLILTPEEGLFCNSITRRVSIRRFP